MKKNRISSLVIALMFVLLTTTVYAACGFYSRKVDDPKSTTTETSARVRYTDDSVTEDIDQDYIYIFGNDIARNEFYDEWHNKDDKHSKEEIEQYIFNERNELKEKELEILQNKNIDISQINSAEKNEGIFHVNAAYINDYPEYRTLYIDYMNEHVGIGDYIPSGIYVDKDLNKAYFVSISDNQVYTYDLK